MNKLKTKFVEIIKNNKFKNLKLLIQENGVKNNSFDFNNYN